MYKIKQVFNLNNTTPAKLKSNPLKILQFFKKKYSKLGNIKLESESNLN